MGGGARLGPPEGLGVRPSSVQYNWVNVGAGGHVIASMWRENKVVVLGPKGRQVLDWGGPRSVDISPDGRFAAVGTWHGARSGVRDLHTGQTCLDLKAWAHPCFSPDGRWLVVSGQDRHEFFRVGLWESPTIVEVKDLNLPCLPAFSGDGQLVAVRDSLTTVKLLRGDTLDLVATVPTRDEDGVSGLVLSRDGRRLLMKGPGPTYLWDLAGVREKLDEMGLAFDWPAYPAVDK